MKMKDNISLALLIALTLCPMSAVAQSHDGESLRGEITIVSSDTKRVKDSLRIEMVMVIDNYCVDSRNSLDLVPVLSTSKRSVKLPMVSVQGRRIYKNYSRTMALRKKNQKPDPDATYLVLKGYRYFSESISYRYTIAYKDWMSEAHMDLHIENHANWKYDKMVVSRLCNVTPVVAVDPSAATAATSAVTTASVTTAAAEVIVPKEVNEPEKTVARKKEGVERVTLHLPGNGKGWQDVQSSDIAKLQMVFDGLTADKNVIVEKIKLVGYTSVEGSLDSNKSLAMVRASSVRDYLCSKYDIPSSVFEVVSGSENWDGLVEALDGSDGLDDSAREEVLDIIAEVPILKGREKKIMDLRDGNVYRQLRKEIFPLLRTVECTIYFR